MLTRKIIAETSVAHFLADEESRHLALSYCDIVHFTDGLASEEKIRHLSELLRSRPEQTQTALCLSLRAKENLTCAHDELSLFALQSNIIKVMDKVDYFALDAEYDLVTPLLNLIPPEKRIITRRITKLDQPGDTGVPARRRRGYRTLASQYQADSQFDAFLYRVICPDGLTALEFLHYNGNDKLIAYDEAEAGLWSRICAFYKGARVIFADLQQTSLLSLEAMEKSYCLTELPEDITGVYGIIGDAIQQSLSPLAHNAGLRALEYPAIYLPFNIDDLTTLDNYISRLAAINLPLRGLTVTAPLKATIGRHYPTTRELVKRACSANVLKVDNDQIQVDTTDDVGLTLLLEQHNISVKGKRVAVLGCGCSGRIAAKTLHEQGAEVTLFNRGVQRAALAHKLLHLPCLSLEDFQPDDFEVLVNTVPFASDSDISFDPDRLAPKMIYIDFVYTPFPNPLLQQANAKECSVIDGLMMLKSQLLSQFYRLTGQLLPPEACQVLESVITEKKSAGKVPHKRLSVSVSRRRNNPQPTGPEKTCRELC
ncbi:hypothetical protein SG34_014680 [Thalassomonas viridans]|uniref:Shikimate dehydrogenase substrate binding N-terminal domain-containing protein n=1 Tax=Thalassomonas viridans TaxID=137584 RepID=A0AAF0CBV1_9GAMM|nr:hypothetical protein [Thalassomonas viridans]WDE08023.1 hypothetical protein SG34_014680 [Thalassomonas viridans]